MLNTRPLAPRSRLPSATPWPPFRRRHRAEGALQIGCKVRSLLLLFFVGFFLQHNLPHDVLVEQIDEEPAHVQAEVMRFEDREDGPEDRWAVEVSVVTGFETAIVDE